MPQMPLALTHEDLTIAPARESDIPLVLEFIRKLADYERLSAEVVADEDVLRKFLFGPKPAAEVLFAYWANQAVGFAVYFHNFSTFIGRPGIYLEDLFVLPAFRGRGVGRAMLVHLARLAKERKCTRLEWAVLDWNEPAIDFYSTLGAIPLNDWTVFRLTESTLDELAKQS